MMHTQVTNPFYFLIIKLYKIILYLYCTYKHPHTSLVTQITIKQKVMHTVNISHTHTHII